MVLHRCVLSLATRSSGSWNPKAWPLTCLRISTTSSRKLLLWGSTWKGTERWWNDHMLVHLLSRHTDHFRAFYSNLFGTFQQSSPLTLVLCRTRMLSSAWFWLRAESTGLPATTRPREYLPPTGSSEYLSRYITIEIPPECVVHISLSHSSIVRTEIFLMC